MSAQWLPRRLCAHSDVHRHPRLLVLEVAARDRPTRAVVDACGAAVHRLQAEERRVEQHLQLEAYGEGEGEGAGA